MSGNFDALGALGAVASMVAGGSSWRARLRQGSYRGARFFCEEMSIDVGRRLAHHEYPGRDTPFDEDLGRKQRQWHFTAYTIGEFYMLERDVLIAALEAAGEGQLVHPSIGTVQATCDTGSITERRDIGGYCAFSLTFFEAGQREYPEGLTDTVSGIEAAADTLTTTLQGVFDGVFNTGAQQSAPAPVTVPSTLTRPGFTRPTTMLGTPTSGGVEQTLVEAAADDVRNLADAFDAVRLPSYGTPQGPLVTAIATLRDQADSLVIHATDLFAAVDTTFQAYTDANSADSGLRGMLAMALFQSHITANEQTGTGQAEARNAAAFQSLVRELALREVGYITPGLTLDSTDRAEHVRRQIVDAFAAQELIVADQGDDPTFIALTTLRVQILADIDQRAAQLPSLTTYHRQRSLNSIVLAWQFYQDADRDIEIVARVDAINPAFMPLTGRVLDQ